MTVDHARPRIAGRSLPALFLISWVVLGCLLPIALIAAETASGVLLYKQVNASTFRYNVDLKNTGTTTVGTLWYSWVPGEDFLGSSPVNVTSPTGWSALVTHGGAGDGYGIQWVNTSTPIQPGKTLAGFGFDIANSPAQMSGNSTFYPGTPIGTTFIYSGAPEADAGAVFSIVPTSKPWQNPFYPLDVDNSGRVNASDALAVISELLSHGSRNLQTPVLSDNVPPFLDVTGSNSLNAMDVLFVVSDLLKNGGHDVSGLKLASPSAAPSVGAFAALDSGPFTTFDFISVPEPSSAALAVLALVSLAALARARRRPAWPAR